VWGGVHNSRGCASSATCAAAFRRAEGKWFLKLAPRRREEGTDRDEQKEEEEEEERDDEEGSGTSDDDTLDGLHDEKE